MCDLVPWATQGLGCELPLARRTETNTCLREGVSDAAWPSSLRLGLNLKGDPARMSDNGADELVRCWCPGEDSNFHSLSGTGT